MSITLHLSESTEKKLAQLASAKGFADVASYNQQLVEQQAQQISDVVAWLVAQRQPVVGRLDARATE